MFLLEIVGDSEKNRLFVGRLFAGWLWKEPVLMQKMLKVVSVVTFTFIQTFDQDFVFFTERRHGLQGMWRVIFSTSGDAT